MNDDFYKRRYRYDAILKNAGRTAVGISLLFLLVLFGSIIFSAIPAFISYEVKLENSSLFNDMEKNDFFSISEESLTKDSWLPASAKLNIALYHDEMDSFTDKEQEAIKQLSIRKKFNYSLFLGQESREPELAGMLTSIMGSIYTILVCLMAALPISVCAAIYLEEFAPKNIFTTLLEVNINNLAAVPSIVFGLIGLAVLINVFEFPRSAPITAGITLAMMIMPAMIITTRQAFSTIPSSIKHAALALGATKTQIIMHHTLPLAIPGIMTGVILSIARAIGETAPLILIGMLAFIVDVPASIFDPATVMPVQIFLWADSPERAFQAKTSAAILVLLFILILINMIAVYIRKKYQHRW